MRTLTDLSEEGLPEALNAKDPNTRAGDGDTENSTHETELDLTAPEVVEVVSELRATCTADQRAEGRTEFIFAIWRSSYVKPVTEDREPVSADR